MPVLGGRNHVAPLVEAIRSFVADSAPSALLAGAGAGVITGVSELTAARLGRSAGELRGRLLLELVAPSDWSALATHLERRRSVEGLRVRLVDAVGGEWPLVGRLAFVGERFLLLGRPGDVLRAEPADPALDLREWGIGHVHEAARRAAAGRRSTSERRSPSGRSDPLPAQAPAQWRESESTRISAARDEERRRLSRDLHDSAQQPLLALAVELDLVAGAAAGYLDLEARLRTLLGHVDDALDAISAIATHEQPPLLADHGLELALADVVGRAPASVSLSCGRVGRYSQEVEAAVYFSCMEAMQNALKHADAARISIVLADRGGTLRFRVSDDGAGFDPDRLARTTGLANIADRIEGVGGRLRIRSAPGTGTTVSATIPPARAMADRAAAAEWPRQSSVSTGTA